MNATTRKRRGPYTDRDIREEIEHQSAMGERANRIHESLGRQEAFAKRVPSLRTVQRIAASVAGRDSTGPWRIQDFSPDDAQLILDVLATVVIETQGRKNQLTQAEAGWVLRIRRGASSMPPWESWLTARFYMGRQADKDRDAKETVDLDCLLAFDPWQGGERANQYFQAILDGWIPVAPLPLIAPLADAQQQHPITPKVLSELRAAPEKAGEVGRRSLEDAKTLQAFMKPKTSQSEEEDTHDTQAR